MTRSTSAAVPTPARRGPASPWNRLRSWQRLVSWRSWLDVSPSRVSPAPRSFSLPCLPCSDAPAASFVSVSVRGGHTCGLTVDGEILCWGCTPWDHDECDPPSGSFVDLAVGGSHSCAIGADGEVTLGVRGVGPVLRGATRAGLGPRCGLLSYLWRRGHRTDRLLGKRGQRSRPNRAPGRSRGSGWCRWSRGSSIAMASSPTFCPRIPRTCRPGRWSAP